MFGNIHVAIAVVQIDHLLALVGGEGVWGCCTEAD